MAGLTLAEAELIGIVLHSALYGIFLVLFVGSIYVPLSRLRRQTAPLNRILMSVQGVTIILFILITIHWILQLLRLIDAFIYHVDDDGGPSAYYANGAESKNVIKTALYLAQMFVGDCTMVYRLYIVWGRNWQVSVLPALLVAGVLVAGSGVVYSFAHLTLGENVFVSSAGHWVLTVLAATLCINITVTSLIAYRIWSLHRHLKGITQHNLMVSHQRSMSRSHTYRVSPPSQCCSTVTLTGYLTKENYQFISLDATSPVIGIAFALIIVRVGLGTSTEATTQTSGAHAPRPPITYTGDSGPPRSIDFQMSKPNCVHGIFHHLEDGTASHDDKITPVVNLTHGSIPRNDDYT
ncbi:hypothetical protein BD779DRAFT_1508743 [Infundibulicybe gibba]|nr:hypothetical protein BD779DRAFT_1508743 [Infundibulicybe gibba]